MTAKDVLILVNVEPVGMYLFYLYLIADVALNSTTFS